MTDKLKDNSPYCSICDSCGVEGCCSPMSCQQHPDGDYCKSYLRDLRFGYVMNRWFENNLLDQLTEEQKDAYNKEWDTAYDKVYEEDNN
jgi:hypothetical protein